MDKQRQVISRNRKRYLYVVLLVEMTARSNERLKKSAAAYGPSSK